MMNTFQFIGLVGGAGAPKTQRSGRIHEERKKAGRDLLAELLFLPS
jgi:hypothetical protein